MFTTVLSVALFSSLAIRGARADFTIDTPAITQCQDVQITWSQTQAPYNLIVVPNDDPCNGVLADLGDHNGLSMTWNADLAAGTVVALSLQDANGDEAWSGAITIASSNDSSCLASSSSVASSAAASFTAVSSVSVSSVAANSVASSSSVAVLPDVTPATTLIVDPDFETTAASPSSSASASASTSGGAVPVGAVNAGDNPTSLNSGASALQTFSVSAMTLVALVAAFVVGV